MTLSQQIITVAMCALGTMATRFLPFAIFSASRPTPPFVRYLGKALPGAVFGLLVVYCLKIVSLLGGSHGLPELISLACVVAVHLWKRNMVLSLIAGTVLHMVLVQWCFV